MFSLCTWHALVYHSTLTGIQVDLSSDREVPGSVQHNKRSSFMEPGYNIAPGSLNLAHISVCLEATRDSCGVA